VRLDLSTFDCPEHRGCLTARDVGRRADLYALAYLCTDNRALVAHLLHEAADLMAAAQRLSTLFLEDGYDYHTRRTGDGLTDAERQQLLTLTSTCVYNAALFVQEAQHRRVTRVHPGWDPITLPVFT
jgi:hypothetical protein